ncbi:Putative Histone acetyltransferase spt10 [[Torrubiella] hemipterigena]|uniref:Putative Histone acetyltransferase spt10 n=1 Tax=[Torrubiella] hemipterigena TaxID=1531966 RepID=A0A0A1TNA5_9HYPO|nr:Putative Histone acetyltransferase spt10 [[Torrubiella] hemipterigena]
MPATVDDPASPTVYRVSGAPPFPDPAFPSLPPDIVPRQVTLRDRQTIATIVPVPSRHQVPPSLLTYLCAQINKEIEGGDTYPFIETFTPDGFADYWFQNFGAVMLLGNIESADALVESGQDWARECLGSFFIKPNYPGRSSHVCNGGLLVTDASRNRGVGRLMGESYIDFAPRLGYTYSVFNCVYETNVASCKIWDALGFKRIGRIKGCGNLKSHPDRLIDAIIYGRDLAPGDSEDLVSEERFDKIKFYLKFGKYPAGADRAEKSRLRSAATHYKLLENDKLMLKDKEVISDPERQYEIARQVHMQHHAGINKTTATIAEKYHWSRIKETVSDAIKTCAKCKDTGKAPTPTPLPTRLGPSPQTQAAPTTHPPPSLPDPATAAPVPIPSAAPAVLNLQNHPMLNTSPPYANLSDISSMQPLHHHHHHPSMLQNTSHHVYQPIDPQMIDTSHHHFDSYNAHADFQALLTATEDVPGGPDSSAMERDLEMLIEQHQHDAVGDHEMVHGGDSDGDEDMHGKDRGLYDVSFDHGPG